MKSAAKFLIAVLASLAAAVVWWTRFPEPPPLPDRLLLVFEPVVMWAVGRDVHGAEELLGFLEI
ncbi:MAG: hypothetical protein ABWY27_08220 [Telluria sp.]